MVEVLDDCLWVTVCDCYLIWHTLRLFLDWKLESVFELLSLFVCRDLLVCLPVYLPVSDCQSAKFFRIMNSLNE